MIEITCTKGINCDYYSIENRSFPAYNMTEITEFLRGKSKDDIEFIRGRQVFAGRPLNDAEFDEMKSKLLSVIGE